VTRVAVQAHSHAQQGFTLVELLLTVTILSLIIGVLTDTLILGLRTTKDTQTRIAQSDAEQFVAHYVTKDVQASVAATPGGTACGVANAALVTTEESVATLATADLAVAYSVAPDGLSRSTCAVGATSAATTSILSDEITSFSAACASPGACGTVHVTVQTAAGTNVPAGAFTLDVIRRQQ
jgi:prepilin-type N-terminal cleavage/methylation domain-containing protein